MATNKELAAQVAAMAEALAALTATGKAKDAAVKDAAVKVEAKKFADADELPSREDVAASRTSKRVAEAAEVTRKVAIGLYGSDFTDTVAIAVARRDAYETVKRVASSREFRTEIVKAAAKDSNFDAATVADMLRAFTPAGEVVCHLKDVKGTMAKARDVRTIPMDFALVAWRGLDRKPFMDDASLAAFAERMMAD